MIRIVTKDNAERHVSNLYQMHRIRKTVFKDRLGWDVTIRGELEIDEYDALGPSYLLDRQARYPQRLCPPSAILLERYFVSLRLPDVMSDVRVPAQPAETNQRRPPPKNL